MDLKAFASAITQIIEDKGISEEKVLETIELALAAAYKRDYGKRGQNIRVEFEPKSGKMKAFQVLEVVEPSMLYTEEEIVAMEEEAQKQRELGRRPETGDKVNLPRSAFFRVLREPQLGQPSDLPLLLWGKMILRSKSITLLTR